jgi:hypothetical protein
MILVGCGPAAAQSDEEDWRWSIAPYVWGSDVSADVSFPSGQSVGGELKFSDIVDKLDFAALVHVEGAYGEMGMFFDATYLSMSDNGLRGPISTASDVEFGLYELAAVYTRGGETGPLGVFMGARVIDTTFDLELSGPGPLGPVHRSTDDRFLDFMVGARYAFSLGERWRLSLRGDVGVGDTEEDWGAIALLGWRFGQDLKHALVAGWRHLQIELEDNGRQTDVSFDGPLVGVSFGW